MQLGLGRLATLAFVPAAAALLCSCADNESSLFVRQVQLESSDCIVEADPSGTALGEGSMDTAFVSEYFAWLLVGNQIVNRGNADQLRTETSKIRLYEYDVRVLDVDGAIVSEYTAPTSGFVDERVGETDHYGLAGAILLDADTATSLGNTAASTQQVQQVVSSVVVRGRTLGGNEVETGEFLFPISICSGCSVFFPTDANDPLQCFLCDATDSEAPEPNCHLGQDRPVDCRLCAGSNPALCNPVDQSADPAICGP